MTVVSVKKGIQDDWRDWPAEYCAAPIEFDRVAYQQKLDEIAGLSRERSILRLEWGGEEQVSRRGALDAGSPNPEAIIFEPKYKLRRKDFLGARVLVPFRRWVIAQLCEWEEYGYGDDTQTTFTDELGVLRRAADKPRDLYTPLIYVGDHRLCPKDCCEEKLCPGDMKHPDAAELFWVAEKTYLLQTERIKSPYDKEFTEAQKLKIAAEYDETRKAKLAEHNKNLETITL